MKLLFYITRNNNGGAERVMTNLANEMARRGHSVAFVVAFTTESDYALERGVRLYDMKINHRGSTPQKLICAFKRTVALRRVIKREEPDAVITFLPYSVVTAALATRFLKTTLIGSVRCDPSISFNKNAVTRFGARFIYSLADGCVFQTKQALEWFPKKMRDRSKVIGNLIDRRFFHTSLTPERSGIIGVGRLSKEKRWDVAIKAFSMVADRYDGSFTIYGRDENGNLDGLRRLARELNLADRVVFAGSVFNIERKLRESRLFVLSSESEGMPNALLEALAVGLPCVTTAFAGGECEFVDNNANGLVVPVGDASVLAEAMIEVLSDDELAERLGRNAKSSSALRYDPDAVCEKWESFIKSVVHKKEGMIS
ncbi:MAG: glycosyltransferase [Synergistaceae bacterium]|jgi:glycosyltransferase involved in cell wall biosynthesis|nr:glycosyltransferase [Synergistaceae bacterium]